MLPPLIKKVVVTNRLSEDDIFGRKGMIYSYVNPVSYVIARKNIELFHDMDGLLVDGSIFILATKILYGRRIKRRSVDMTSLLATLFEDTTKSFYLVGSKQEEIERSINILKEHFKNIKIVGYRNGFFAHNEDILDEYRKIIENNPDYVLVGMGVISQESFLKGLKKSGYSGIGLACGGFISQVSMNGIRYYPEWIDRYNLRFVYRFLKEKHTRKRYMKSAIMFPVLFLYDKLKYLFI